MRDRRNNQVMGTGRARDGWRARWAVPVRAGEAQRQCGTEETMRERIEGGGHARARLVQTTGGSGVVRKAVGAEQQRLNRAC